MFNDWARVLVAEDNAINREVASELLGAAGLTVDVAANGLEALDKASHGHYDLILMDVCMPVMDGLASTRAIRALPECANTPIVAITAYTPDECLSACEEAGMNDFIGKPVQMDELYARVLKWLTVGAHNSADGLSSQASQQAH
jgi:two-component system, sensor histidine kinase and response regulator